MKEKLALFGGRAVRKKFLPFHQPFIGKEEIKEVEETLKSGWLTTGPRTELFEKRFKEYIGAKFAVGLNSCTAGLHLSLVALNIGKGDEVITSPFTFPSTANVIIHQGAKPLFVDIERGTLNIDPEKIEKAITERTKAIIPIHFAGHPSEMDRIADIAKRHNLFIIEDAAHAIEAKYKNKKVGTIGDTTSFSFYATKNITTGEGGMLTTNNKEIAEKVRILRLHGMSKGAWKRYQEKGYQHWETIYPGYKYNMSDLQAALGLVQLKRIEKFWKIRKRYTEIYSKELCKIPEIILPLEKEKIKDSYHLYVIRIKTEELTADRDKIITALEEENIGIGIHFRSLHLHPYYQKTYHFKRGDFPVAEYASDRVVSLPLYPKMSEDDLSDVVKAVKKVISAFRK